MIKFTKMHGLGNDYVFIDLIREDQKRLVDNKIDDINLPKVVRFISDRHFGVGSDGLVLIMPSAKADFRMRMFNADGTEAQMCGNAIRCVGKYVYDNGYTKCTKISIETLAGIKNLDMIIDNGKVSLVKVDMGEPILKPRDIPVMSDKDIFISQPVIIDGMVYNITCVSMGNPHAIIYVDDVNKIPIDKLGPKIENHSLFPEKTNVEFAQVVDRKTIKMRVWERGTGETMACGTGACAVLVSSVLNGLSERKAAVKPLGGDLIIEWNENDGHVYMTGPAVKVFDGKIDLTQI